MAVWSCAVLFSCSALSVAIALVSDLKHSGLMAGQSSALCGAAAPLVFVCAVAMLFRISRLGYSLGLLAGSMALYWLILAEVVEYPLSSWRFLNYWGEASPDESRFLLSIKFRLLSIAIVSVTVVCALLRLLLARFVLNGSPCCLRTWPAVTVCSLILIVWFVRSVSPYRSPNWNPRPPPGFLIAKVERNGIGFHETGVSGSRDGRVWVWRDNRRLFEYRFETRVSSGSMSQAALEHALDFMDSPTVVGASGLTPVKLGLYEIDGWYAVVNGSRAFAFSERSVTRPPKQMTDLFYEIEALPMVEGEPRATRDVCFGFCFDFIRPLAGIPR
jgi:hypothetical protein